MSNHMPALMCQHPARLAPPSVRRSAGVLTDAGRHLALHAPAGLVVHVHPARDSVPRLVLDSGACACDGVCGVGGSHQKGGRDVYRR
jgi:hypothetical protein